MFTKVAVFCIVLAVSNASILAPTHLINTGVSSRSQTQDGHGNYAFGYSIQDKLGATNSRSEVGDGWGNKKGSYTLADIDGRARKVEYVADKLGFRAVVKTNEPGTAASAPAAAVIASPYAAPMAQSAISHVAPVAAIAAPVIAAPAIAAAPIAAIGGHGLGLGAGVLGAGALGGLGLVNGAGVLGANGLGGLGLANGAGLMGAGIYGAGLGKGLY